jgi:hypothetical protein
MPGASPATGSKISKSTVGSPLESDASAMSSSSLVPHIPVSALNLYTGGNIYASQSTRNGVEYKEWCDWRRGALERLVRRGFPRSAFHALEDTVRREGGLLHHVFDARNLEITVRSWWHTVATKEFVGLVYEICVER